MADLQPDKRTMDKWPTGLVRHLRLNADVPPDQAIATREGDLERDGFTDIHYTLNVHPSQAGNVETIRAHVEANPNIGGVFSPERDH